MKPLNKYIDHTNLKPFATKADIEKLCADAKTYDFASVCVNPCDITLAKKLLAGTDVKVCTVIGFPLGRNQTEIKVAEAKAALADGCEEFDMVINVGKLKDGEIDYVRDEIKAIVTEYLKTNTFIRRADIERVASLTRATAQRVVRTLVADNFIVNISGDQHHPLYALA